MTSDNVDSYIRYATDDEIVLYATLLRLFDVLDRLSQGHREAALLAVRKVVSEHGDMQVWRSAIEDWDDL